MKKEILTTKGLEDFIKKVTVEALGSALAPVQRAEEERQKKKAEELKGLQAEESGSDIDEAEDEDKEEETKKSDEDTKLASEVPTVTTKKLARASLQDVIKMLNTLRSGRSVKDPTIKKQLKDYLDALPQDQRETLYVFLTGLSEIMVGGEAGKEAMDPVEIGIKISAPDASEKEVKKSKKATAKTKEEIGTEEAPIVVGESTNRMMEKKLFREYSRK